MIPAAKTPASPGKSDPLVRRLLEGDGETLRTVTGTIRAVVAARGFYVPVDQQADLVQEVLLDLWRQLGRRAAPVRCLLALTRTVAYRRCVDWVRQLENRGEMPLEPPDRRESPERKALGSERRRLALQVLERLRPSCRELIRLRSGEGLRWRTIAERLGRSEKAVRNQMVDCLKTARFLLRRLERPRPGRQE